MIGAEPLSDEGQSFLAGFAADVDIFRCEIFARHFCYRRRGRRPPFETRLKPFQLEIHPLHDERHPVDACFKKRHTSLRKLFQHAAQDDADAVHRDR